MDKEKVFWQFLRDLKYLGDDVKGQVIYGGCSWREPSPIPGAVRRLKELNWEDIDDSLASVLCNEIAKTKLKNKVAELFDYHKYGLDLDCSADEKERFYAGWLNRFFLICAEAGMADMFEEKEEKDTTDSGSSEPQGGVDINDIPEDIYSLFKPTFNNKGIIQQKARDVAKEYLDKVRGCSLSVCAHTYNREYGRKGKAITGNEWGHKKKKLYDFLVSHTDAKEINSKRFARLLK